MAMVVGASALLLIAGCSVPASGETDDEADAVQVSVANERDEDTLQAEPEPTIQERLDASFGTFDPITESGNGDAVVSLPSASGAVIEVKYTGDRNFVVWTLDDGNEERDLLVNTVGSYEGNAAYFDDGATQLKVSANGSWTIVVSPLSAAPMMTGNDSGRGDSVLLYDTEAARWDFTHNGARNFIVYRLVPGDLELLVNTIGVYEGTVPVTAAAGVVTIQADGDWTLTAN